MKKPARKIGKASAKSSQKRKAPKPSPTVVRGGLTINRATPQTGKATRQAELKPTKPWPKPKG
jgi:hypothetical protein